ncbi:hypothetical protein N7468_008826 [Penicillium chermesinum]|uniref:tyrosinase n=1 Tax=Penicillium chermesinum TaxID=63820 RepID=A0A9W9NGR8_9EURO|nr:uncharacterized protein N7468_008826 [Penicillium chermesinum]KAJ5219622.1 hypothetical protein N7468_008826 [Penicillium chermesinum]
MSSQVKGVAKANITAQTPVPLRQNIDTWSGDPANDKEVKLFVAALDRFQKIDPSDRDSYFQIAGIHGQPNVPWDETIEEAEAKGKGYCTHNNILFPIWHRAYLALYEQRISELAKEIVSGFDEEVRPEWEEAAENWRLPFWDWGTQATVPNLSKSPIAIVPTADGKGEQPIPNPLYQFRNPQGQPWGALKVENFKDPWVPEGGKLLFFSECVATSRWPDEPDVQSGSEGWKHGTVNNLKVKESLERSEWMTEAPAGAKPAELVYRLLTVPMEYSTFATTAQASPDQKVENDINLEYIHNNIHGWVGGDFNGHMSQIPVATFDPLFWLHHCNIDRIWALWQTLNPDKWFTEGTVNEFFQKTIGLEQGAKFGPDVGLRPFHVDTKGTLIKPTDGGAFDSASYVADVRERINNLYGVSRQALQKATNLKGVEYGPDALKALEYSFSIRFAKYAFGGEPFWIRVYIAREGSKQNATTDLIAEVYNFSQTPDDAAGRAACRNCKNNQKQNLKVTANLSITPVLINIIKSGAKDLPSLSRNDVLKYLQKKVYWRVFQFGQEVPRHKLDPLELEVIGASNDCTHFNDPKKPPLVENFKKEPTLTGGSDGALDPALKQPAIPPPPPPKTESHKANLNVGKVLQFKKPLTPDSVVIIDSTSLNLTPFKGNGIDNSQFYFTSGADGKGDIVFLLSVRRAENAIVFNTLIGNSWGKEERVTLDKRFRTDKPSILVHDQGDGYEIFIDYRHVYWFEKRSKDAPAKAIAYTVNKGQSPVWSTGLTVKVFGSMREVFHH